VIEVLIRDFQLNDMDEIVEILKLNNQYGFPAVDGPEAMKRIKEISTERRLQGCLETVARRLERCPMRDLTSS